MLSDLLRKCLASQFIQPALGNRLAERLGVDLLIKHKGRLAMQFNQLFSSCSFGLRAYAALSLLCAVLYLPGFFSIPPTDRDEARFAQATRQMLETGDYVRINFQDKARHKKPAGAYWIQAAAVSVLSDVNARQIWAYRVPSLIAAWLTVLITFWVATRLIGERAAFLAALALASSASLAVEARLAKADALLVLCVVTTVGSLGCLFLDRNEPATSRTRWLAYLMWFSLGAGVLVKGPVLPAVLLLTVATLLFCTDGRWFWRLRPLSGALIVAALILPWFYAVQEATSGAFVADAVSGDILPKLTGSHESHGAPPGYYTLFVFITFWPWSYGIIPAALWIIRNRKTDAGNFLFAWLVPSWIALESVPTKLPHYTLPLFPPLAVACAAAFYQQGIDNLAKHPKLCKLGNSIWILVTAVLALVSVTSAVMFKGSTVWSGLSAALLLLGILLFVKNSSSLNNTRTLRAVFVCLTGLLIFVELVLPSLTDFWSSKKMIDHLAAKGLYTQGRNRLIVTGYSEPSLVFLSDTNTILTTPEQAPKELKLHCDSILLLRERDREKFDQSMVEIGPLASPIDTIEVFNYSNGKWLNFFLYSGNRCERDGID